MESKCFNSPIKVSESNEKEYDFELYLDTDANAYLMSKKLKGDIFSCIFGCTPKNSAMKKFFPRTNLYKRIMLPNLQNMVIDPNGMPVGKSDILLPWTDMTAPHLIVEPSSFIPRKSDSSADQIANINIIAPKDVVMLYFDSVTVNDELVRRPTLILTSKNHAETMITMSGEKPEQLHELYMDGVSIKLDQTKQLEQISKNDSKQFKIVEAKPINQETSEFLTQLYS